MTRCRVRRLLTKAHERLDDGGETKLLGLLAAGDPRGDVRMARHAKEVVRSIDEISEPELALEFVEELGHDLQESHARPKCARSVGPSCAGGTRSSPGVGRSCPMVRPRQSTT